LNIPWFKPTAYLGATTISGGNALLKAPDVFPEFSAAANGECTLWATETAELQDAKTLKFFQLVLQQCKIFFEFLGEVFAVKADSGMIAGEIFSAFVPPCQKQPAS